MMFPSRTKVYRSQEGSRHIVTVLNPYGSGHQWGCIATGATAAEAEHKASEWTWRNVEKAAAAGCLLATIGIVERESKRLSDALALLAMNCG